MHPWLPEALLRGFPRTVLPRATGDVSGNVGEHASLLLGFLHWTASIFEVFAAVSAPLLGFLLKPIYYVQPAERLPLMVDGLDIM